MRRSRPRHRDTLLRRSGGREAYSRVLVVAEGQKTEAAYLSDIAEHYRLSTANVVILGQGADPATVVREAIKLKRRETQRGDAYDRVFCVFDRDSHATFDVASQRAAANGVQLARSWPCFEYWLLLHFRLTRSPYVRTRTRSPCDQCIHELRRHLPDYHKAQHDVFTTLLPYLEKAKDNAGRAHRDFVATGERNPSTDMHRLVSFLQQLKPSSEAQTHKVS